jgi:hypothetical protein
VDTGRNREVSGLGVNRHLHLFFIRHVKEEVPCSDEEDRKSRQHWRWVENQVKGLPVPNRAYFDSLHFRIYAWTMQKIQQTIKNFGALDLLTPQQGMMVRLKKAGATIEPTEDTRLCGEYRSFAKKQLPFNSDDRIVHDSYFEIIDQRDKFIANQIHKTLRPGETGFLFQGVHHKIQGFLEADIELRVYPGDMKAVPRNYIP